MRSDPFIFPHLLTKGPVTRAGSWLGWQSACRIHGKCCLACCDERDLGVSLGLALSICGVCHGHGVGSGSAVPGSWKLQRKLTGRAEQATGSQSSGVGSSGGRSLTHTAADVTGPLDRPSRGMPASTGASLPVQATHLGHAAQHLWLMGDTEAQGTTMCPRALGPVGRSRAAPT